VERAPGCLDWVTATAQVSGMSDTTDLDRPVGPRLANETQVSKTVASQAPFARTLGTHQGPA